MSKCLDQKQYISRSNPSGALFATRVARLAQSVEHETLNLRVVGSSPTLGAAFSNHTRDIKSLEQKLQEEEMYTSRRCGLVGQSACLVNRRSW